MPNEMACSWFIGGLTARAVVSMPHGCDDRPRNDPGKHSQYRDPFEGSETAPDLTMRVGCSQWMVAESLPCRECKHSDLADILWPSGPGPLMSHRPSVCCWNGDTQDGLLHDSAKAPSYLGVMHDGIRGSANCSARRSDADLSSLATSPPIVATGPRSPWAKSTDHSCFPIRPNARSFFRLARRPPVARSSEMMQ